MNWTSLWQSILHPFWQRAPRWIRRRLIWAGSTKFLVGVAVLALNPQGQMLLLNHRFHPTYPWGMPGGWLDRGETPLAGALRELKEETGLVPSQIELLAVDGDGEWVEIYFLCRLPAGEPRLQESELLGYRWVEPASCDLRLPPRQQKVLARFNRGQWPSSGNPFSSLALPDEP